LTLDTATFLAAFLGAGLGAAFLALTTRFAAAAFLVGFAFVAVFRVTAFGALAAVARFALILVAGFALTVRFVVFAEVRFALDRAVDLRKPFVRLLLILLQSQKGCSNTLSSHRNVAELTTASPLNQLAQLLAVALRCHNGAHFGLKSINIEKHLMVIVWLCYSAF
jgi:hypothetical protein